MTHDTRHKTQEGHDKDQNGRMNVKRKILVKKLFASNFLFVGLRHVSCVLCLVTLALFASCGYTTSSTLPSNIKTIRIEPFKNSIDFTAEGARNIYLPLLEVKARNEVVKRFLRDGNLKIVDTPHADLVLEGELKRYSRGGLRYTDDDDVQEYRVQVVVSFELTNVHNEEFSWKEPSFVGEATYFVTGPQATTEEAAVDEALLDLARRIVERTVEDW